MTPLTRGVLFKIQHEVIMYTETASNFHKLFEQLGLSSNKNDIEQFIANNSLQKNERLIDLPFWNDSQISFIKEEIDKDAEWAVVIDELTTLLKKEQEI